MTTTDARDVRVCMRDGEPLIFTFEFPGAEYVCGVCGGLEDIFGDRAPATPERQRRLDELTEKYQRERAERDGRTYTPPPKAGDEGVTVPTCITCGATPPEGVALPGGKPQAWFSRTDFDTRVTTYACSRACIPKNESVLPW